MAEAQRKSAGDVVVNYVVSLIVKGELKPGDKLSNERELSAKLNVSRVSLREAISSLTAAGILEPRQGAGTYVGKFDPAKMAETVYLFALLDGASLPELLETRRALEVESASQAAARATQSQKDALEALLERAETDWDPELSLSFHLAVAEAAENVFLAKLLETVARCGEQLWRQREAPVPDKASTLDYYRRVLWAIRAGDSRGAYAAMQEYMVWLIRWAAES